MTCGIYRIIHVASGKNYVGSAKNIEKRAVAHLGQLELGKHYNRHLQNAYSKYGRDAFRLEIIKECAENERLTWEQRYISDAWDSGLLYNMNPVAGRGPSTSEAVAKRLATIAAKSPEEKAAWLERLRMANLGKKRSLESVEKFKATVAAKPTEERAAITKRMLATRAAMNPDEKASIYARVGESYRATWAAKSQEEKESHRQAILEVWRKKTLEQRESRAAKISASLMGKKASPEAIEKNRANRIGKKASAETRRKMSESRTGMKMSQECLDKRVATWAAKSPEELAEIRSKMWETRRRNKAAKE